MFDGVGRYYSLTEKGFIALVDQLCKNLGGTLKRVKFVEIDLSEELSALLAAKLETIGAKLEYN